MPKFLLQESHYAGTYSNPFKYRGKGVKYSKWVTVRAGQVTHMRFVKKLPGGEL
jgi:hypothetical protein